MPGLRCVGVIDYFSQFSQPTAVLSTVSGRLDESAAISHFRWSQFRGQTDVMIRTGICQFEKASLLTLSLSACTAGLFSSVHIGKPTLSQCISLTQSGKYRLRAGLRLREPALRTTDVSLYSGP